MTDSRWSVQLSTRKTWRHHVWTASLLTLNALALVGAGGLYYHQQQQTALWQQHFDDQQRELEQLHQQWRQANDTNAGLQRQLQQQAAQVAALTNDPQRHGQQLADEAEHYLNLAEQGLQQQQLVMARELLDHIDSLLSKDSDSRWQPVRQALAADRLALTTTEQTDVVSLTARIDALKNQIANSSWSTPAATIATPTAAETNSVWEHLGQIFRQLVVIRHHDLPPQPLLSDNQRWLVQSNLRLELTRAQLAIVQHQPELYRQALQQAQSLADQMVSPTQRVLMTELTQLQQITIPSLPTSLVHTRDALMVVKEAIGHITSTTLPVPATPAEASPTSEPVPATVTEPAAKESSAAGASL